MSVRDELIRTANLKLATEDGNKLFDELTETAGILAADMDAVLNGKDLRAAVLAASWLIGKLAWELGPNSFDETMVAVQMNAEDHFKYCLSREGGVSA